MHDINIKSRGAASELLPKINDPYLDLLKKCLTRFIFPDNTWSPVHPPSRENHPIVSRLYPVINAMLERKGIRLCRQHAKFDPIARAEGKDWPAEADTMIGLKRLDNLHACIEAVINDQVQGTLSRLGSGGEVLASLCA